MSSPDMKHVLCTGIAVVDQVFRVANFPRPDVKTQASEFRTVNGGNAANAAVAIVHLGARASFAGPLGGPAGADSVGDTFLALAAKENIDCPACPRVAGAPSSISAICIDARGERSIVNYRDEGLTAARAADPDALVASVDAVMADNRFPEFVADVCRAAMKRRIPVVLDADEPRRDSNALLTLATHVIFSAEGLRATAGTDHLGRALIDISKQTTAFLAVTDGANDVLWLDGDSRLQGRSRRHARRRRHLPRGVHADAGRRHGRASRDAFRGRDRGAEMHALRRHPGRTDARRGRGVSGAAGIGSYFFCADGHGAPQGAQAPAKSSGETARALDGLIRWSATTAASPAMTTKA